MPKLIEYLPSIMKELKEIKILSGVEQKEIDCLWTALDDILKEAFIESESDFGAKKWESILDIEPKDSDSLEIRNFRIQTKLNSGLPYTYRRLQQQLASLCGKDGYTLELNSINYTLKVRVALKSKEVLQETEKMLDEVVPADLRITVELMYNTHKMLGKYTHRQLSQFTHKQLREMQL